MGNAVWTHIDIHGEITSTESFKTLTEALSRTGEIKIGDNNVARDTGAIRQALVAANLLDKPLHIRCYTRNGDTELFEKAGKQGIDLRVKTVGWGGSGPRIFFVKNGVKSLTLTEDGNSAAISLKLVNTLPSRGMKTISDLQDFLSLYHQEPPVFRISDDVIQELFIPSRKP